MTRNRLEWAEDYSATLHESGLQRQVLKAPEYWLNRKVLAASVRGIVDNLSVTADGGVMWSAEQILRIIAPVEIDFHRSADQARRPCRRQSGAGRDDQASGL